MKPLLLPVLLLFLTPLALMGASKPGNKLPEEVAQALETAASLTLYSLEPWEQAGFLDRKLHGYKVLGRTSLKGEEARAAALEFKQVVTAWTGMSAMCFDPRQAIRVQAGGHVYDLLMCYSCLKLYIYRDDKLLWSLGAQGSPGLLIKLLTDAGVKVSKSDSDEDAEETAARNRTAKDRWRQAMPRSIRLLWNQTIELAIMPDTAPFSKVLKKEYPDNQARILALYAWYGSGEGPWSGFPAYESIPEELLLEFDTPSLILAAQSPDLTPAQVEGAARLFGSWTFGKERPDDRALLPKELKKKLLVHSLKTDNKDKRIRAKSAFK